MAHHACIYSSYNIIIIAQSLSVDVATCFSSLKLTAIAFVGKQCLRQGRNGHPCPLSSAALREIAREANAKRVPGAPLIEGHTTVTATGEVDVIAERCTRCRTAAMALAAPNLVRRLLDRGMCSVAVV